MKNALTLLIFLLLTSPILHVHAQSDLGKSKVLICISNTAERFHKSRCNGLNQCTHTINEVTRSKAEEMGRTPCKICYSNTSSSDFGTGNSSSGSGGCPTVQCSGTTQKGLRCRNRTTNCGGRCYHHD